MNTTDTPRTSQVKALRDRFLDVFRQAAALRGERMDVVDDEGRPEMAWVLYERAQMTAAINAARREQGRDPISHRVVARADRTAAGHIDYADKFPLYCAEIALDAFSAQRP